MPPAPGTIAVVPAATADVDVAISSIAAVSAIDPFPAISFLTAIRPAAAIGSSPAVPFATVEMRAARPGAAVDRASAARRTIHRRPAAARSAHATTATTSTRVPHRWACASSSTAATAATATVPTSAASAAPMSATATFALGECDRGRGGAYPGTRRESEHQSGDCRDARFLQQGHCQAPFFPSVRTTSGARLGSGAEGGGNLLPAGTAAMAQAYCLRRFKRTRTMEDGRHERKAADGGSPAAADGHESRARQPIVKSAEAARAGSISGRVVTVLVVSLVLAAIVSAAVLYYFQGAAGPTGS